MQYNLGVPLTFMYEFRLQLSSGNLAYSRYLMTGFPPFLGRISGEFFNPTSVSIHPPGRISNGGMDSTN
jgi:hypothetical protein